MNGRETRPPLDEGKGGIPAWPVWLRPLLVMLPVLLLVAILLVIILVFRVFIISKVHGCTHRRQSVKKVVEMDERRAKSRAVVETPALTTRSSSLHEARSTQPCDQSAYAHLPPHRIPLPPTDDEAEELPSRTVALGSGSTQDWARNQLFESRPTVSRQSYTQVLEEEEYPEADCKDVDDENDVVDIQPVGKKPMSIRGTSNKPSGSWGKRTNKSSPGGSDGKGDVDVKGGRNFWSVEHRVALVRVKRDQDGHLEGAEVHAGVRKTGLLPAEGQGKEIRSFNFVMERAVNEEIKASTTKNHIIHPKNVANTDTPDGVEMSSGSSGGPESVGGGEEGGKAQEEEEGSTKGFSFNKGSTGGFSKRKNMRQQTFEALTAVMEMHGTLMATTLQSASKRQCSMRHCEIMESKVKETLCGVR
ncbi:hypothetical protein CBR_g29360 [Chara braunii]|uniref:Uncharacterized protein n=1 Tax=Chara braunii TaxID=69332 RepID=A0A388JWH0_CHABU|nr:hypothetical protein CBR_g29360 [Chara braunii]|eukprot:GBG62161.1 hypothetical protein CBR_g29360 [Chara braunii]